MLIVVDWPQKDLQVLVAKMELLAPEKDNISFATRAEKLNWEKVGILQLHTAFSENIIIYRLHLMIILQQNVKERGFVYKKDFAGFEF